ncbi:chromosome partitioning protein [Dyadobacter sp. SG02]|uniref:ParA family protein n=1 Tax=Dyadobacter sp. SG02 TaxID=1855291 RepID=UPI0008C803D7|nr:ParA family protein [Dyadobacter sp. SG02]SEI97564.1 chromosome partitioning protein [Dyadobacter sp. SG02]
MKIISIVNNKGGVGKTTSAQSIAAGLSKFANARVLVIDLDAQASLTKSFGIHHAGLKKDSGSFITGEYEFDEIVKRVGDIDVLPGSAEMIHREDTIKSAPVFPFNLKIALEKVKDRYDFVIIDCPPALYGNTRLALVSCHQYYVPLQAEFLSYEGLRNFLVYSAEIKKISPSTNLGGVFATRYNPKIRKKISHELIMATREQLGEVFMEAYIRDNIALSEAQASGTTIFEYAPHSNGAEDYYKLTKEILERINN